MPIAPLIAFFGFPVEARGKWPTSSYDLFRTLGLSKSRSPRFAKVISRRALLYSLDILKAFGLECGIGGWKLALFGSGKFHPFGAWKFAE